MKVKSAYECHSCKILHFRYSILKIGLMSELSFPLKRRSKALFIYLINKSVIFYKVIAKTNTPSNQLAGPSNATFSEFFAPGLPVYRIPNRRPKVFPIVKP